MDSFISSFLETFKAAQEDFDACEARAFAHFEQQKLLAQESLFIEYECVDVNATPRYRESKHQEQLAAEKLRLVPRSVSNYERYQLISEEEIMSLLDSVSLHTFTGELIILPRKAALRAALQAGSDNVPERLVVWVDGSFLKTAGAGVVHWLPSQARRIEKGYHISPCANSSRAEFIALSEGLSVALKHIKEHERERTQVKEVQIFTDSQEVLLKARSLIARAPGQKELQSDMALVKLITASQLLKQSGVSVELHWVPGHAGVQGNQKAHSVATKARAYQKICWNLQHEDRCSSQTNGITRSSFCDGPSSPNS